MLQIKEYYQKIVNLFAKGEDFSLLLIRLTLAYGFFQPAIKKFSNLQGTANFFSSIGIPLPYLNALMAASTEMAGVVLLVLGLGLRVFSIPLVFVMLVAIFTVHISHGFAAGSNGFEIPFYYILFLVVLMTRGSGKFSVDQIVFKSNK